MGHISVAAYRPRPGKEAALLELTKEHLPILRSQNLATERPATVMRAADGTIIEVFEWTSTEAIAAAHSNPVVGKLWERYGDVCEFVPLAGVKECSDMFAGFEPIDL